MHDGSNAKEMLPQMSSTKMPVTQPLPWTTGDILAATGGELLCGDTHKIFAGVSIDSRNITPEGLFVAIRGQVHDGHTFIPEVVAGGVQGIIVDQKNAREFLTGRWQEKGIVLIAVRETTRALGDLAAFNRKRVAVSVIAITGSNGKTTTKEMLAHILSKHQKTLKSPKSFIFRFNNKAIVKPAIRPKGTPKKV